MTITAHLERAADEILLFGIELELCQPESSGGSWHGSDGYSECPDCGSCGVPDCDECSQCDTCEYGYCDDHRGEVAIALAAMARHKLTEPNPYKHSYHCDCERCYYDRSSPFFAAQNDCTVGVEFVSRICHIREDVDYLDTVALALRDAYSNGVSLPDGHQPWGNHIHVGCQNRRAVSRWGAALFASDNWDWESIASGGCRSGGVRGYNGKPAKNGGWSDDGNHGEWTSERGETCEFRLWNTPADPDLIGFHVCASLAIARWAAAQTAVQGIPERLIRGFDDLCDPVQTLEQLQSVWPSNPRIDAHFARMEANLC